MAGMEFVRECQENVASEYAVDGSRVVGSSRIEKLDELYAAMRDMLKRGVSPDSLRSEVEAAIKHSHSHKWVAIELEHYRCECGEELYGMLIH